MIHAPAAGSKLSVRNVSRVFSGTANVVALAGVSVEIESGEYVAIVGPSGSGKSTLLNVLGLLDAPTAGVYEIDGIDVTHQREPLKAKLRSQTFGFVFQEFHLIDHRPAIDNVALALVYRGVSYRARIAAAYDALSAVGLEHRVDAMPNTMSGGERQRTAVARALVTQPSVILCDEPTGSLDPHSASTVLDLLDSVNARGATVVVITHDATTAQRTQRQVSIRDGQIVG